LAILLKIFFALGFLPKKLVGDAIPYLIENSPTNNIDFSIYILEY